eukprot:Gregarina_sp_Poly_1__3003@NODE_1843_length_3231_cov_5_701011_g1196_i0_p2_GENE_NODE_1843_length_3231_cov_5_701011_g1196_i0NODE_1843_length_3231_cov_5_701011_g1196_i0_p2_ORF_typecomplete_len149_score25_52_NODE_1843_length_3231_cov_5_701011_g1196_i021442590
MIRDHFGWQSENPVEDIYSENVDTPSRNPITKNSDISNNLSTSISEKREWELPSSSQTSLKNIPNNQNSIIQNLVTQDFASPDFSSPDLDSLYFIGEDLDVEDLIQQYLFLSTSLPRLRFVFALMAQLAPNERAAVLPERKRSLSHTR